MQPLQLHGALFLASSGGNGHLAAAKSRAETVAARYPSCKIVSRNVLDDFLGKTIGQSISARWDNAKKAGSIALMHKMVRLQSIADALFFIPIFLKTLFHLASLPGPCIRVISTQPLGLSAIAKAIRVFNYFRNLISDVPPVTLELWLTDYAAKGATHFIKPIEKLSAADKALLEVHIPNEREKEGEAFGVTTGLNPKQVVLSKPSDLPVSAHFKNTDLINGSLPGSANTFTLKLTPTQQNLVAQSLNRSVMDDSPLKDCTYSIDAGDKMYTLMLGSQPSANTVKAFVSALIEAQSATHLPSRKPTPCHAFICCGADKEKTPSLFREISQELARLQKQGAIPSHLHIVPLPFQDPPGLCRLMAHADELLIAGGGLSAFEARVLQDTSKGRCGKVSVVSEAAVNIGEWPHNFNALARKGMLSWEADNAAYLKAPLLTASAFQATLLEHFYFWQHSEQHRD